MITDVVGLCNTMPDVFIIVYNISKKRNIGTIIRSASAFGIHDIIIVGNRKFNTFGNMSTLHNVRFHYWSNLTTLKECLDKNSIIVIGIEIDNSAIPITQASFVNKKIAFMLGNEGTGMTKKQLEICNQLVYIPQYSTSTASLNVAMASTIVFHYWAFGQKFNVDKVILRDFNFSETINKSHEW